MTHQDKITIILTFLIGIAAGAYLYLTGFAPTYQLPVVDIDKQYADLIIVGDEYGQCTTLGKCLSFQVLNDRTYRALLGSGGEEGITNGKISFGLQTKLRKAITKKSLVLAEQEFRESACQAENTTGRHLTFHITFEQITYNLDSCYSTLDYESELWTALKELRFEIEKAI